MNKNFSSGFTLIEVILTLAVLVVIFGIAAPVYQDYQIRNGLDTAANTIVENLRRAQTSAQAVDGDLAWGVNIAAGNITLFKGASFAGRDLAFDESSDMLSSISPAGLLEIVFAKQTGLPAAGALTLSAGGTVRTISINEKGMLAY